MDISDAELENSLDHLIDVEPDFLDIETEEMLLEENFDSNKLNNKIAKDQTLKKKIENSKSKQTFVVQSQTKNTKKTTKQENSYLKADSAKQNSEKWSSIRKRKGNRKWFPRGGNKYRRHQNNFEQDHNITTTNYNHNNRNSFHNFLTNSWTNNKNVGLKRNFMTDEQLFYKSNELINLIRCSSCANVFSSSNMCRMNMYMNCENNLNTRPNFLSNFENNQGNFMMDQHSFNTSNELINLIRYSLRANMEAINRLNIYKLEFITLITEKLFDLIDLM